MAPKSVVGLGTVLSVPFFQPCQLSAKMVVVPGWEKSIVYNCAILYKSYSNNELRLMQLSIGIHLK